MEYVRRIAEAEGSGRKDCIMDILKEMGAEFQVQKFEGAENVIISFRPAEKRMVIGAHWDAEEGSTGANDNASGCCVLLRVIKALLSQKDFQKSVDFVFFGEEERGSIGASSYIEAVGKENITAMVNLDMCGFGNEILVNEKGNHSNPLFGGIMAQSVLEKHKVQLPGFLPQGDDYIFDINNIPNISVCAADEEARVFFSDLARKMAAEQPLDENDQERFVGLKLIKTMHGGELDDISFINGKAIEMVFAYLLDGFLQA